MRAILYLIIEGPEGTRGGDARDTRRTGGLSRGDRSGPQGHKDPAAKPPPGPGSGLTYPLGILELEKALHIIFFKGEDDGHGYRNICKYLGDRNLI